jgi:hypothetical protein
MQFPFANRRTPIQKTDGAESYRVPDRLDGQILGSRRPNYVFNHASVAPGFPMFPPTSVVDGARPTSVSTRHSHLSTYGVGLMRLFSNERPAF